MRPICDRYSRPTKFFIYFLFSLDFTPILAYNKHVNKRGVRPKEDTEMLMNAEMIKKVLANANFSLQGDTKQKRIKVQTFGNFEVFVDGKQLFFEREKAKELFAYLVDRRGASVTNTEIALILWEDDTKVRNVGTIMSSLRKTLKDAGLQEVLVKARNHTAIDPSLIQCDLYDFYQGDPVAMNSYQGEYMINYSWAELTNGNLMTQQNN